MLRYFRKWSIALKRRRLRKERQRLERYSSIEQDVRGGGSACYNCNAPLTGPFCHICGQKDDDLRRPIWTFFKELLDAIFDTDSKIIKTILLLVFIPGGLSRDFMEGKRARYLPPFRLYIVLLFIFFSALSLADILIIDIHVTPKAETVAARQALEAEIAAAQEVRDQVQEARERAKAAAENLEAQTESGFANPIEPIDPIALEQQIQESIAAAEQNAREVAASAQVDALLKVIENLERQNTADSEAIEDFLETLTDELSSIEGEGEETDFVAARDRARALLDDPATQLSDDSKTAIQALLSLDPRALAVAADAGVDGSGGINIGDLPYNFDIDMFVANDNDEREGIKQEDIDFILEDPDTPEIVKKATEGFMEGLRSPREFNKLFNDWLPWALVFLMPVFAGILRLTHWGKKRYYLNQLVFALHFHSFLFVMLTVFAFIMPMVEGGPAFAIFWWGTSLYLIIALKVGQQQGWTRAFLKAGFIWVGYFVIMMWTMAAVMFFGISDSTVGEFVELVQNANDEAAEETTSPEAPNSLEFSPSQE